MQRFTALLTTLLALAIAEGAHADTYQLKTGGEVVGTLVERGDRGSYVVKTTEGVQLTLPRFEVMKIIPENPALEEYQQRSRSLPDTVAAHRALAEWCREQKLLEEADHHLERLLKLNPSDQAARLSLGYQRHGNRWMTQEQIMQDRGMVLHEGKYRTPQDLALRKVQEQIDNEEADWYGKLKNYRNWLTNRRQTRVQEAQDEIARIEDPRAVPALLKWLADEPDEWTRRLLLNTLQAIPHPDVTRTLVRLSVESENPDERQQCLDYLLRSETPVSLAPYVKYLTDKKSDNVIVNRAGYALGQLGNEQAISPLIDRLITRHKYVVQPGGGNEINASMTPTGGGGLSMGGKGPKIKYVDHKNLEVLRALGSLSGGQDFGYNAVAWRRWFVNEQQYKYFSSRRDQ